MVESKDNVKVAIRVRPLNEKEFSEGGKKCISVSASFPTIQIGEHKSFTYDYVADESTSQEKLFEMVGHPIASSCLSGYNGTIFAYGQTGSGKTFTIQGLGAEDISPDSSQYPYRGILPRCFEYIFASIASAVKSSNIEFLVKCSYLEIYQEQINDLLDPNPHNLQLREDMKKGVYVEGLIEHPARNLIQTYALLKIGARNRHVSSTSMNKESSRSHSVFTVNIESKSKFDGLINFKSSRFNLIDLAGSERQKTTACVGERLKEAGMINKSLSALGNVINSLVEVSEGKIRHIPYRDSKLTFLLRDSLGGNSKTFIIANVSPSVSALSETLSTLKFAQRAKLIKNSAVINEDTSGTVLLLKAEIKRLKEELENVQQIAELAINKCPKCAGQIDLPSLVHTFEKNLEIETLLENNLKLRIEGEKEWQKLQNDKESQIESLKNLINQLESKAAHDKMILKFRNNTIEKLTENDLNAGIKEIMEEVKILNEQLENNPYIAKLNAENKILNEEISELRAELESAFASTRQENERLKDFTEKLNESLRNSCVEKEKIKTVFKELMEGRDLNEIFQGFEEKYECELERLQKEIQEMQKGKLINLQSGENDLNHDKSIENLYKYEKEIEELKLKLVTETQLKEKFLVEKFTSEKTISDLTQKISDLFSYTEKCCVLESQLEMTKQQYEDKYREHLLASQEIDNLSEITEFLKCEIESLTSSLSSQSSTIKNLQQSLSAYEKLSKDQADLIESLQDPTGNKTLALALSERDEYKLKSHELELELTALKKSHSDLQNSQNLLIKSNESGQIELKSARFTIGQLKEKLESSQTLLSESQENEQSLNEEVQRFKEIIEREKHHSDILRERMMNKHNETLNKLILEKTEMVKEIDVLKNNQFKLNFEINELKNKESHNAERLAAEIRKNERINDEVIEVRVQLEKTKKDFNSDKKNFEIKEKIALDELERVKLEYEKIFDENQKFNKIVEDLNCEKEKNLQLESLVESLKDLVEIEKSESQKEKFLKREVENVKEKVEEQLKISEVDKKNLKLALSITEKEKREFQERFEIITREKEKLSEEIQQISCEKQNLLIESQLLSLEKENLNSELKHLNSDKEKLQKSLESLSSDLKKSHTKQEETKKLLTRLESEKKSLSEQISTQKSCIEDLESRLKSLEDHLDSLEKSKDFISTEKDQLQTFYFQSIESVKKIEDSLKLANNELEKEKNKNKSLTIDYQCVKVAQEELLKKFNNHLAKYSELEEKWKKDYEKLLESETKSIKLIDKTHDLERKSEDDQEIINELKNQVKSLNGQVKYLQDNFEIIKEKNNKNFKDQIEAAHSQVFEYEERLKQVIKEKEEEILLIQSKNNEKIQQIINDLKNFEKKNSELKKENEIIKDELLRSQDFNQNFSDIEREMKSLKNENQVYIKKNKELFQVIEEKNKKNKEQEIICINLLSEQEQAKIQIDSFYAQISELKKSLQAATGNLEEGKIANFKLVNENKDLKFAVAKIKEEKERLAKECEEKEIIIEELEKGRDEEREKVQSLERSFLEVSEEFMIEKQKHAPIEEVIAELKQKLHKTNESFIISQDESRKIIQDLHEKTKKLEDKAAGQTKIINNYLDSLKSLENSLKASEDCKSSLNQQLEQLKLNENVYSLEISSLKSQLSLLADQQKQTHLELSKARQIANEKEKVLNEISEKNFKLEQVNKKLEQDSKENLTSLNLINSEFSIAQEDLNKAKQEIAKLKEELKTRVDQDNYLGGDDQSTWQRRIEDKNQTIQDLKNQLDLLKQDMKQSNNDKYHEKQCEYLSKLLRVKEKELNDLKSKGMSELETSFDLKKKEAELATKKHEAAKAELNQVKSDLLQSLQEREDLTSELKSLRDSDSRSKRDLNESKAMNNQLKEDNLRLLKEITKINEEFHKITEKNFWEIEPVDRQNMKIKKMEEIMTGLENQVRTKTSELEKCNKILTEMKKKTLDEGNIRKEFERQNEEIEILNSGLAKITQFVFSLVSPDPEDTCVIESTLKGIKRLAEDSQAKEFKGRGMKRHDSGNVSRHVPMTSASEKSLRVQSPGIRPKRFK